MASKLTDIGKAASSQPSSVVLPTSQVHRRLVPKKRKRKSDKDKKPCHPSTPSMMPISAVVSKASAPSYVLIPAFPSSHPSTLAHTPSSANEPNRTTLLSLPEAPFCVPSSTRDLSPKIDSAANTTSTTLLVPATDLLLVPSSITVSPALWESPSTDPDVSGEKGKGHMCPSDLLPKLERRKVAGFVPISNEPQRVKSGFDLGGK